MQPTLQTLIEQLPYVGPNYVKRLKHLGIKNVKDLLFHFPHRYDDFSQITPIKDINLDEKVTIQGKILEIKSTRTWRKRMTLTEAIVKDDTGAIKAVWFNQPYLINYLFKGQLASLSGKARISKDELILSNPAYEVLRSKSAITLHTARLVPVYPETQGLSSRWLRYKIQSILHLTNKFQDFLPVEIKKNQKLLDLPQALKQIHFPQNQTLAQSAKKRLAFNELFLIQLFSLKQKKQWQEQKSYPIAFPEKTIKDFVKSLPFKLTSAQRIAAWQIFQDMEKTTPMNRLLEGDVGSGKTVVAALAALAAIKNGFQTALMAPTEILAKQHFENIVKFLDNTEVNPVRSKPPEVTTTPLARTSNGVKIGLLTSGETFINNSAKIKKTEITRLVSGGTISLLIGTHSLLQETIKFKNLALVVIDEQHRFGVEQRAKLQQQIIQDDQDKIIPHLLTMTATPIPRTLALTVYGDLDLSVLNEMPKGRQEIITKVVAPANRMLAYEFIRKQTKQGRQVFVICPRIEIAENPANSNQNLPPNLPRTMNTLIVSPRNSEQKSQMEILQSYERQSMVRGLLVNEVKSVEKEYEKLSQKIFPDLRIAKLHGKLKSKEKNEIMNKFKNREIDIIVATSVIEVGIDIPNATIMMIEGSERFGLAQLYQFRGRVGRGQHQSYCFLFTDSNSTTTHKRLKAIINAKNGFELAQKDLEIRGPGQFLGTRQWGMPDLTMASITDQELIQQTRNEAQKILEQDFELKKFPLLKEEIKNFQAQIHFE